MFKNKRGYSTGFSFVFGLVTLFGLGILFIVFDQVFLAYLVPTIKNLVNTTGNIPIATQTEIYANIDKYIDIWHALPFVLFFAVIIYMGIAAVRREKESEYYG